MRVIRREYAAPYLRVAMLLAIEKCRCSGTKEAAIIIGPSGEIVGSSYKSVQDGYGHALCRGECLLHGWKSDIVKSENALCISEHTLRTVLIKTFSIGVSLLNSTIFLVAVEGEELIIPSDVECCDSCRKIFIASGAEIVLWNSTGKNIGCIAYSAYDIDQNLHLRFAPTMPRRDNRFQLSDFSELASGA